MIERLWAVDIEGSGMSPPEIVELAIVELEELRLTGNRKHWRIRPRNGISASASRIHGIFARDVERAPDIEDVVEDILMWLDECSVVGHNVRVEIELLGRVLEGWRPPAAFDTLRVARRLLPREKKHGLQYIGTILGLVPATVEAVDGYPHSAPYDATMTALLFIRLIEPLSDLERRGILADADVLRHNQGTLL